MAFWKQQNKIDDLPLDPLGYDEPPEGKKTARTVSDFWKRRPQRKRKKQPLQRIEDIQAQYEASGELDTDAVLSLYLPQRRIRRFGAALLRLNKLQLLLLGLLVALMVLFIMSFMQEKMGNFTINLNRLEMYRKGISIASDPDFKDSSSRLIAEAVSNATNISISDLPNDLDRGEGSHNGKNYMAYSYYLRNAGKEDVTYRATVRLEEATKGAEKAVRVAVWRNGERTVYAAPAANGEPEPGCENFYNDKTVCVYDEPEFLVGNVDRYTVAIWLEGDDPECVDNIVGGSLQMSMNIDSDDENDTSLFVKFLQDIADVITGDKPIFGSSDSDAPNFYKDQEITWDNRRNQ